MNASGTPEYEAALAAVDAFDAETQRLGLPWHKRLWLRLTGWLCWRCQCQKVDFKSENWLCARCETVEKMLENVQ